MRAILRRPLVLGAAALFVLVAGLAAAVGAGWAILTVSDAQIVAAAHLGMLDQPGLVGPVQVVTDLGSPTAVDVVSVVFGTALAIGLRWAAVVTLVVARLGELGCETLLKHLLDRPRPALDPALASAGGFSFPSGHAGGSAAVYGALALVALGWHRAHRPRPPSSVWAVPVGIAVTLLIAAVACSRVLLGVHYPSDVIAGTALGLGWALLAAGIAEPRGRAVFDERRDSDPARRSRRGVPDERR